MGAGHVDGWVGGQALGTGACAVLRGSLGCPGPARRPGDWSDGRQRWCGWVGRRRPLAREKPSRTPGGWKQARGGAPYLSGLWLQGPQLGPGSEAGWGVRAGAPPWPSGGWPATSAGRRLAAESWFGKGCLLRGRAALWPYSGPRSPGSPRASLL